MSTPITLTDTIGKGGEATIYAIAQQTNAVAKIYHQPTAAHEAKLRAMVANPPEQPRSHVALAWPTALIYQTKAGQLASYVNNYPNGEKFVGFLMPKISSGCSIFNMYNPVMRKNLPYPFDGRALHRAAYNLCATVASVHAKGYVIGDINESNILVNRESLVTLVDCDSFQVTDTHGTIHRCLVGKPEYTPQGKNFKKIDQRPEHDIFGLGVLLFQLLMNGFHPFAGVLPSNLSVGRVDLYAIRQGLFPYADQPSISPPPAAPPFDHLHPQLQAIFNECFIKGHTHPATRPSARQWQDALLVAEQSLVTCKKNHLYSQHLGECPECVLFPFRNYQKEYHFQTANIPTELLALIAQAIQAYKHENAATVLKLMTQVIDSGKAPMEAFAYRAWAYQQQGDTETALRDVQHAIKHLPNFPFSYYVLGRCQFDLQQYTEAETAFSQAITWKYEDMYQLYYWRGLTYKAMNSDAKAEADFKQAMHSPAAYWRKQAHQQLKQMKPTNLLSAKQTPYFAAVPIGEILCLEGVS